MSNMSELTDGIKRVQYSEEILAELESTLSPERLSTYLRVVSDGDKEQGVRLYVCSSRRTSMRPFRTWHDTRAGAVFSTTLRNDADPTLQMAQHLYRLANARES